MSRPDTCRRKPRRQSPAPVIIKLLVLGLALWCTGCAAAPLTPVPTPVPLVATATRVSTPSRVVPTATAESRPMARPSPAPTETATSSTSSLDRLLARRTVEDLLARLERGEFSSVVNLYLSDEALQTGMDRVFLELENVDRELVEAELLQFGQATASSYEARVLLHWAEGSQGESASQPMTLRLVYQRGLWLVDQASLGDARSGDSVQEQAHQAPTDRRTRRDATLDGTLVFQVSSGGAIYLVDADGSNLRPLADGLDPAWSPGADRIAFTRWRYPWGVYLVQPDGTGEERVVAGDQLKEVAWSPGGEKIAFTVNKGASEPIEICILGRCFTIPAFSAAQLWTVDLDSGDFLSLPLHDQVVHAPTWSPSEGRIVYAGEKGLAWIDLDDMKTGRFPGGSAWDSSPTYSPDGKRLAFMSRVHNHWEVLVMKADGSGRQQLTHSDPRPEIPASNVAPAWSPDGQSIAFLSNRDGPWRIFIMAADGSGQRSMFGAQLDHLGLRYEWASERVLSWTN